MDYVFPLRFHNLVQRAALSLLPPLPLRLLYELLPLLPCNRYQNVQRILYSPTAGTTRLENVAISPLYYVFFCYGSITLYNVAALTPPRPALIVRTAYYYTNSLLCCRVTNIKR